jgi:hypothetical protein
MFGPYNSKVASGGRNRGQSSERPDWPPGPQWVGGVHGKTKSSAESLGCETLWYRPARAWVQEVAQSYWPSHRFPMPPLDVGALCPQHPEGATSAPTMVFSTEQIKSQNLVVDLVHREIHPAASIGIVIAGNSGLPGGATCPIVRGGVAPWALDPAKVHPEHRTQEESVVSNWIRHQIEPLGETNPAEKPGEKMRKLVVATIGGEWGLKSADAHDLITMQGVDYVNSHNPADYHDCWVVRFAKVGAEDHRGYTVEGLAQPTQVGGLFFACAPNANAANRDFGSMARTKNKLASSDFSFFSDGLKAAIVGVVDAAIQEQKHGNPVTVLVFNPLGGGIYWPGRRSQQRGGGPTVGFYQQLVNEVLDTEVDAEGGKKYKRWQFFQGIYFSFLSPNPV